MPLLDDTVTKFASGLINRLRCGRRHVRARVPFISPSRADAARREARAFLDERRREMADALDRHT